jgi:hypothetical protein
LDWPSRGLKTRLNNVGHWSVIEEVDELADSICIPLIPEQGSGNALSNPWYVIGDPMISLEALRRTTGRRSNLAYIDVPRIRTNAGTFDAAEREAVLDTWLTVVQGLIRRSYAMLDDKGAIAVLCGIEETHFVRMLLDEICGPSNHLGTIAWQKNYSPRNMPNMVEVSPTHDNLLLFARRKASIQRLSLKVPPEGFINRDGDPRGDWNAEQKGANKPDCDYEVNICPYRWSISSGELPPGIWRVNPKSGVIWGLGKDLVKSGKWTFTIRVVDKSGVSAEKSFSIVVSADTPAPSPAQIPWLERVDGLDTTGALRIETTSLPPARLGSDYSACVVAAGGKPWEGTTRPGKTAAGGKGRYWEFPLKTLVGEAAMDRVDFKSRDDAIPAPKSYLNGALYTHLNQTSVWVGGSKGAEAGGARGDVGWSQEAKEELEALVKVGAVSETIGISKPARLMARLIALFDSSDGCIVDVGSPAGEMASIATAMGRRAIYVEVNTTQELRSGLLLKRLEYAARGHHPIPEVVDFMDQPRPNAGAISRYLVSGSPRPITEHARPYVLTVGQQFADLDRSTGACFIDYSRYPERDPVFLQSLASLEGLVSIADDPTKGVFGTNFEGTLLAIHIDSATRLDSRWLDSALSAYAKHLEDGGRVRVYYHRGSPPSEQDSSLEYRRIPYELNLLASLI